MQTDEMSVGQAWTALPIQIKLKSPSQFPHTKQYPLKPEGRWGPYAYQNSLKNKGYWLVATVHIINLKFL
jgi:hypothetical protein